jgi:hypothetical protein
MNKMERLYNYLIHYNPYTKLWNAIPRDSYPAYWSNRKVDGVISSTKIKTLIELITRGDEFIKTIK